jgi:orotidine-5'-phosphate decarboxylase
MADSFTVSLRHAWARSDSLLCVGLDPDPARFPRHLAGAPDAILRFCTAIVDATADLACAFKPQIAYFAAHRAEDQLEALIAHIHARHPGVPVVLDAKRGDIGSTAEQYAREVFERYDADAVTVSPYMGFDSVEPLLAHPGRGVILLCRTSNPGGAWNRGGELGLVVGATVPAELARVREIAPTLPLLVPGVGAQGGDVEATVRAGRTADGTGMMINSSRAILYAGAGEDFAEAARRVAIETRDAINRFRGA